MTGSPRALAAYDYLRSLGIAEEALLVEVDGTDTYTELAASAAILDAAGIGPVGTAGHRRLSLAAHLDDRH